jgi:hypothetical protein
MSIRPAQNQFVPLQSTDIARETTRTSAQRIRPQEAVSDEERSYFQKLFPGAEAEIKQYSTYSPAGLRASGSSGTMIDRKG